MVPRERQPGSHVILKSDGGELPDGAFEDAARLAAYYSASTGPENGQAEIDYVRKKEVKKPNGAKPGFVVYYTNYSMMIDTDISGLTLVIRDPDQRSIAALFDPRSSCYFTTILMIFFGT